MSYKKKVETMTDEELDREFDRKYKERWLRQDRARHQLAWVKLIGLCLIAVVMLGSCVASSLMVNLTVDTNNDGYYEVVTIPKWKVNDYKAQYPTRD